MRPDDTFDPASAESWKLMRERLSNLPVPSIARWSACTGVLGLSLALLFYRLGDGSLYDWDEAIYAQAAKEMLHTRAWGSLSWDGYPFLHKPPLYFWLTALTYHLIGIHEFAARLWSALFGFGILILTFAFGARLRSWTVGVGAVLLLLGVDRAYYSQWWNFLSLSRVGLMDTALTFWVMITLLLIWQSDRRPWLLALVGIPVGLALLTKAWPGLFAMLIALPYWHLTRRGQTSHLGYWTVAVILAAAVALPWHLWQYSLHGHFFLREYVGFNLLERVLQTVEMHHGGPFFYLSVIRRGFSIWGYALPLAYLLGVWRAWRKGDQGAVLLLCWVAIPLLLFSIAQTKLGWYINMVYPPLALLLAIALADLLGARVALGVVAIGMLACCLHSPAPADGSPDVKAFAREALQIVNPGDALYVIRSACANEGPSHTAGELFLTDTHIRPSMVFYLNRRLTCVTERHVLEGSGLQGAYVIIDGESWPRFSHLGQVVLQVLEDGHGYLLARMK
ncbi:MAG: glycosyltransferase family 39 protein [Candidatus Tectomicrobia bacterium]|nr:glycosyltransferase family 39 protein [Candidatus Tectomicrobia bacterium]